MLLQTRTKKANIDTDISLLLAFFSVWTFGSMFFFATADRDLDMLYA